ncbi:hypothetical protein N7495_004189 [Penicillium taxi]|uniref:uncharacterized protein n=1 Tax=Penicillium taxi TaxID=168475 RepID=UPI002545B7D1|nr:uncharacterized protein N7495_004189 [Penicillium taxi]KAJ5899445.1 hypothetical protein N7495_004189 [Penicillium taxi]
MDASLDSARPEPQAWCRLGAECPFIHVSPISGQSQTSAADQPSESLSAVDKSTDSDGGVALDMQKLKVSEQQPTQKSASHAAQSSKSVSRPTSRPISKLEQKDPREFQINQLRRRFSPSEITDDSETALTFGLPPSDPDFPFELDALQCVLRVPLSYPIKGRPSLTVTNLEMEHVYQANVARGFDDIVDFTLRTNGQGNLLSWLNSLDKQLEKLLTTLERGPKLTFVANSGGNVMGKEPERNRNEKQIQSQSATVPNTAVSKPAPKKLSQHSFIIPIQSNKPDRIPRSLQTVKTVKLLIPPLYPLEHSSIQIQGNDSPEARSAETGFTQWVQKNAQLNLVSQINYLASNIHNFAKTLLPEIAEYSQHEHVPSKTETSAIEPEQQETDSNVTMEDRPHVQVIPRPPEWSMTERESDSEITEESSYDEESNNEGDDENLEGGVPLPAIIDSPGRGVALSFPFLELYGIELLELTHISITVKCDRCKETMDIKNVPQIADPKISPKTESCRKCAKNMTLGFRRQLMHSHANRAGYLDLDGCTIVDLLPSNFIPTCSECSTAYHAPGVCAVRGESAMAICRHCHRKMVLKIPEVKFLAVGSAGISSRAGLALKKKPKEALGIVAGQELPRRGRCQHYSKSYRWFRFSCCSKVFPCDRCHDAESDHPNEHANRIICGFCSREQIYRPENCGICKAVLIGKKGSGFWEGGKGTRNKALMSRKDPRKFKRVGGSVVGSSTSKRK